MRKNPIKKVNVVFEGGGVKGIGLVGAVKALEDAGYSFNGIAGTSAGAIAASLLAAGYTAKEMKSALDTTDYLKFKQKGLLDKFGLPGKALSIFINYGVFSSVYFEHWLGSLLEKKGVRQFGDVKNARNEPQKYKFQAIASDITSKRILVLPDDLERFGYDIDKFSVASAVRMSMSIPVFFEPVKLTDKAGRQHIILDGGLLSNYPLWLFENDTDIETIGIRFGKNTSEINKMLLHNPTSNFIEYLKCVVDTMLEAHDKQHISVSNGDFNRTVFVSPTVNAGGISKEIKSTYFEITPDEAEALYQNGIIAAERFLKKPEHRQ